MASQWFYQAMGQQIGPVSAADLRNLAQRGTIAADTLVRKGPDGSWVPAQRVQGLFSTANINPPSRPVTAQPNEQPSAPPPNNRATANASDTPSKTSSSARPEGNDFTKWLRLNIRQTLIAWPIIATLIALLVVAVTSDQAVPEDGHWPGKCLARGLSAFSLFRSASWPSGCTFCRLSRQNVAIIHTTSAS